MKVYRKSAPVDATRWVKNGDHPQDHAWLPPGVAPKHVEGHVVRYYRHPEVRGAHVCTDCGATMYNHGWIDSGIAGYRVCPGDWVVTGVDGKYYPLKPSIFSALFGE